MTECGPRHAGATLATRAGAVLYSRAMKRLLASLLLLPALASAAIPVPGGYAGGQVGVSFVGSLVLVK